MMLGSSGLVLPVLITTGSADEVSVLVGSVPVWAGTVGSIVVGSDPTMAAGTSRPSRDSRRSRRPTERLVDMRVRAPGNENAGGPRPAEPLGPFIVQAGGRTAAD